MTDPNDPMAPSTRPEPPPFDRDAFVHALREAVTRDFAEVKLPEDRMEKLVHYGALLVEASRTVNLTRILDPQDVSLKHFLDTSHLLPLLRGARGPVVDIGTGGGVPGIPLAILRGDLTVHLIDGTAKKIKLLKAWIEELELSNAEAFHVRAEERLRKIRYPVGVLRAAVKPAAMMEILAGTGPALGRILFMEGRDGPERARRLKTKAKKAGYVLDQALPYKLPGMDNDRHIVVFKRIRRR